MSTDVNKYLVFRVGEEEHAVPLLSVREVSSMRPTRPVPETPAHYLGVTNLRGNVISVISLPAKLGVQSRATDASKAILVFDLSSTTVGVMVDEVVSVVSLGSEDIDYEGHRALPVAGQHLFGVAKIGERLVTLLDLYNLLDGDIGGIAA